ncbi:MAG: DUF3073 domain-containing protein [Actinomycetota bacterium]|jgi:hypothetical protein|nr:DUF3073 domain-containing protein [Actinomycetota bacterium]
MGRGRAKAKQTKVARELKYSGGTLDPERLKAELAGATPSPFSPAPSATDDDEFDDPYADQLEDDEPAR